MKTILHYYYLNLDDPMQREEYIKLKKSLVEMNLCLFDSISFGQSDWYKSKIKPLDGQEIELETKYLFNNQWNTASTLTSDKGIRVFDWAEAIYPNKNIKEGQWLEQTEEMIKIRQDFTRCHWCGEISHRITSILPEYKTCPHCEKEGYLIDLTSRKWEFLK